MRYRDDVIGTNDIGGWHCDSKEKAIKQENGHKSPLQSWFAELENFQTFNSEPGEECDIWFEKPIYIMKLDATVNMYHHFCDFINLYATLHLNNYFSKDNNIIIWDTLPYRSNFGLIWKAFSRNRILDLNNYRGKKVCFREAIFPLLPRMIYGIYYNMPLIPGCHGSALFQAFNEHVLYNLNIKPKFFEKSLRVTFLSRQTKYRKVLNEEELLKSVKQKIPDVEIFKVDFNHAMPFKSQVEISASSDILIGMHGAGLTHCLFQPKWGALFELYNCEDEHCYKDLARLRGVKYVTWENKDKLYPEDEGHHPEMGAHAKFTNYKFDVEEFIRLLKVAVEYVRKERLRPNILIKDEL